VLESIFPEDSVNKRPNVLFLHYGVLQGLKSWGQTRFYQPIIK